MKLMMMWQILKIEGYEYDDANAAKSSIFLSIELYRS